MSAGSEWMRNNVWSLTLPGRPRRRRRRRDWRRSFTRFLANLSLGFLLFGCASTPVRRISGLASLPRKHPVDVLADSTDSRERLDAYRRLGDPRKLGEQDRRLALEELTRAVTSEHNPLVRTTAAGSLAAYPQAESIAALSRALDDQDAHVRAEACRSLGKIGAASSVEPLGRVLETDSDVDARVAAVEALAMFQHPSALVPLLKGLDDDELVVVKTAALGLKINSSEDFGADRAAWAAYVAERVPPEAVAARPDTDTVR